MTSAAPWDLTALLNAADPRATLPERHLWLARLMQWLRHGAVAADDGAKTPRPVLRLRQLLQVLDQHPPHREAVQGLMQAFWREIDIAALFADLGFSPRLALASAMWQRVRAKVLPGTPVTHDLAALFPLLFEDRDDTWLSALDEPTLARAARLLGPEDGSACWRSGLLDALAHLVSAVRSAGFAAPMRLRMDPPLLVNDPFGQLARSADALAAALLAGDAAATAQNALYLRALLDACRLAAASIAEHLEEHGVSVDIVFEADQLRARTQRIEQLLDALLAPTPPEALRLLLALVEAQAGSRGIRALFSRHYSMLARQVAERSAETGERYIARSGAEYRDMLGRAAGGGVVIAGTTLVKFGLAALGLSAFWGGFWAGVNYSLSFVLIMLLHWTLATKQPAMTAPALAARLEAGHREADQDEPVRIETFVDEVAHLIRSQAAGIVGNVALCVPLVLGLQWLGAQLFGSPPVGHEDAEYVLKSLTLLGPTALFAAFTGVLLFASSLVAGWAENWFVFHRLDSAIAWNPSIVARLGAARAQRWSHWWRDNVSGLAASISLGMMLGLLPAVFGFFGLGLDVRHVTLASGQLAAALGAEGPGLLQRAEFWWCAAAIGVIGGLNLGVSFWLAFKVALRSRDIAVRERRAIYAALRRRMWRAPLSFLWPPRAAPPSPPSSPSVP